VSDSRKPTPRERRSLNQRALMMLEHAALVRGLRARLLTQLTPAELVALDYCTSALVDGASIIGEIGNLS
jgi:hypothetical protein